MRTKTLPCNNIPQALGMASVPLPVGDGSIPLASVGVYPSTSPALTPGYLYRWATEEGNYKGPYQLLDNGTAIFAAQLAQAVSHPVHLFFSVVPSGYIQLSCMSNHTKL